MIIAVSSTGHSLESQLDKQIDRSAYFLVIDSDTMSLIKAIPNPYASSKELIRHLNELKVKALLTGDCSDEIADSFKMNGIEIYRGYPGFSVRAAVQNFKEQFPALR